MPDQWDDFSGIGVRRDIFFMIRVDTGFLRASPIGILRAMVSGQRIACHAMPKSRWRTGGRDDTVSVERWIRVIAGTFVLASVLLGVYVNGYFLIFTAFVGVNLFQSGLTRWCLMESILKKLGVPAH
jgi:hypothetical protein